MPSDQATEAITDHLLDRVLPAAYRPIPGQPAPRYDLATTQRALTRIAAQMNREGTRDLNWWEIPNWAPRTPRVLAAGLAAGLVGGLAVGLTVGLTTVPVDGLVFGLVFGGMMGLRTGETAGREVMSGDRPRTVGAFRPSEALNALAFALAPGFMFGGMIGLGLGLGLGHGFVAGLVAALTFMIAIGILSGFGAFAADSDNYSSLNPVTSWRSNQSYGLAAAFTGGLVTGIAGGLIAGIAGGLVVGAGSGLAVGLFFWLTGWLTTNTWVTLIAFAQLANEWDARMRPMRFLDDAYSRNVLRAVGPSYQFRHARLQDRLAAAEPARPSDRGAPALVVNADSPPATGMPQQAR
jgi:hypothetical protein